VGDSGPIDFAGLNAALLDRGHILVPQWLPGGRMQGHEYVCGGLDGGEGRSLSVNLNTGKWADFAGDEEDKGGDLLSLYARKHGLSMSQAARELMRDLGWQRSPVQTSAHRAGAAPPDPPADDDQPAPPGDDESGPAPAPGPGPTPPGKKRSLWQPVVPVPAHAPPPRFRHGYQNEAGQWVDMEYVCHWEYRIDGQLYGYVARFHRPSSSGEVKKETVPFTWCIDTSDGRGQQRWHTKGWEDPRPLYLPAGALAVDPALVPVVIVEGEKCAKAGHDLLPGEFDFVTWPGGAATWAKGDWPRLRGRVVYLWADCDAKRARLTKAEREAGADPATKPLLPELRQAGVRAMVNIGSRLAADLGCTVLWCPIPKPGEVPDGWDIADAIADGWDAARVRDFIRSAHPFVPPDDAARAKGTIEAKIHARALAGADTQEMDPQAWRDALIKGPKGSIERVRDNIVIALNGVPEKGIPGVPEAAGAIAYCEFSNRVVKTRRSPWGTAPGEWGEEDELLMGQWLTQEYWLPSMARATLEEAVLMVSRRHAFHPVRARYEGLRGKHDGIRRLGTWLRRVCMVEDEFDDEAPLQRYLARVGTWMIMGMVARVMRATSDPQGLRTGPGCKFDYMVIFEGAQGLGKSTLASVLGGDHFADSNLHIGDKDSYQNLQGVSIYEFGELETMSKSDIRAVKLFVSSRTDRFRASFDRRARNYPRQCIFIGTTNDNRYLTDPTGNRRFWPVLVQQQIDLAWVRANLDQMIAEAIVYLDAGERFHPTAAEQKELFSPQQDDRVIDNPIAGRITSYLHPIGNPTGPASDGLLISSITLVDLLAKIGLGLDKLGPGRFHERQAAAALRQLGWTERRSSGPGRPWVWHRPETVVRVTPPPPPSHDAGSSTSTGPDDCPF
jgi:putative DNA primase/helicase